MNNTVFSIFLFILGLIIGFVVVFIVNFLKKKSDNKKADSIIETAKKDADKIKRDSLFETKEEIHKLKIDADKKLKKRRVKLKNRKIYDFKEKTILIVGIWLFKIGSLLLMREKIIY